jgi:hypothetical protein
LKNPDLTNLNVHEAIYKGLGKVVNRYRTLNEEITQGLEVTMKENRNNSIET